LLRATKLCPLVLVIDAHCHRKPWLGRVHAAVTRTDHAGLPPGGWHAEQAMTLVEAFRAFTLDAAYAEHAEQRIGSLEPGKCADFILIDRDLFTMPQRISGSCASRRPGSRASASTDCTPGVAGKEL